MKLAVISPDTNVLKTMGLSYHFVLAQRVRHDRDALAFYRAMSDSGGFVIVDNGAAEYEPVHFDDLLEVANRVHADEVILPDALRDYGKTLAMSLDRKVLLGVPPRHRFAVPQGSNWIEWEDCLVQLLKGAKPATIGVPKWLDELPGGRERALSILLGRNVHYTCNIHLLGVAGDFAHEVFSLGTKSVRGIDTGLPIAMAQAGRLLTDSPRESLSWKRPFDTRLAERNINIALNICKEVTQCTYQ